MKSKSLYTVILLKLNLVEGTREFEEAYAYCLSYLTNGITAYQFQSVIKKYLPQGDKDISAKVFRLYLMSNKYNYFTIKLFVLQLSKIRRGDWEHVQTLAKKTGILNRDVKVIFTLWESSPNFRRRIKLWVYELPNKTDLSLKGLEVEFSKVIFPEVLKKIKSLTYHKLRFIIKTSNLDCADMHNELALKALQAYYRITPDARGPLFIINYVKQAVHHHAMNIIQSSTTQKGGRLKDNGVDSMGVRKAPTLLEVSENQMPVSMGKSSDGEALDYSLQNQSYCAVDPTETIENEISVSTILDKYKSRTKKYRLILILMGTVDEDFTTWLRARKHCSYKEDNADVQERLGQLDFRKLISQFLHVADDKVNVFLTELQTKMSERNKLTTKGTFNEQCSKLARTKPHKCTGVQPTTYVHVSVNSTHSYVEPRAFNGA